VSGPSPQARWPAALAALLAGPAFLLLDTAVALARGWEPRTGSHRILTIACLGALAVGAATAALPAGRRLLERRWAALVTLAVASAVGLLAAEAAARLLPRWLGGPLAHSRGPGVHRVFRPDPRLVRGIRGESHYTTSSLGVRGGEIPSSPGVLRLLCVGGSTTECTYLDHAETWSHLVGERLAAAGRPAWVGNLGIAGYTTIEHLDFLDGAPALPIDGAVFLVGINDLVRYLNGSIELGPRPLWRRSTLAGAALSFHRRAFLRRLLFEVEDPTGANLAERRRIRREAPDAGPLPPLDGALREYGARLAGLGRECRRRRLPCLFLTQPVLWRSDLDAASRATLWMGEDTQGRFYSPGELRRGMDLYNAALLATCARHRLDCLDLGALHGREELFYDDCHFTEAGAREMARIVAGHLLAGARGRG
jgi:lysophospholipase L1-like esterase